MFQEGRVLAFDLDRPRARPTPLSTGAAIMEARLGTVDSRSAETKHILVAGDSTMGWNIARTEKATDEGFVWNLRNRAEVSAELGGAVLIAKVLKERYETQDAGSDPVVIHEFQESTFPKGHDAEGYNHSYIVWQKYPKWARRDDGELAWRVHEVLGFHGSNTAPLKKAKAHPPADLIVLSDMDLRFRQDQRRWPKEITTENHEAPKPWILIRTSAPRPEGALWDALIKGHADRLVIVTALDELTRSGVRVRRGLSWEGLAWDIASQIVKDPSLHKLTSAARFIVSLGTGGAIVLTKAPKSRPDAAWEDRPICNVVFDPESIENSWAEHHHGQTIGYSICLMAGIVPGLLRGEVRTPELLEGIRRGLVAGRVLRVEGASVVDPGPPTDSQVTGVRSESTKLEFPTRLV